MAGDVSLYFSHSAHKTGSNICFSVDVCAVDGSRPSYAVQLSLFENGTNVLWHFTSTDPNLSGFRFSTFCITTDGNKAGGRICCGMAFLNNPNQSFLVWKKRLGLDPHCDLQHRSGHTMLISEFYVRSWATEVSAPYRPLSRIF